MAQRTKAGMRFVALKGKESSVSGVARGLAVCWGEQCERESQTVPSPAHRLRHPAFFLPLPGGQDHQVFFKILLSLFMLVGL